MRREPFFPRVGEYLRDRRRGFPNKVLSAHNIVYFPIPKVANSYVSAVFLKNCPDAKDYDPARMTALKYWQTSDACRVTRLAEITDPSVAKIAILRDPAERLVSCFLDKLVRRNERQQPDVETFCKDASRLLHRPIAPAEVTFEDFAAYCFKTPDWRRERHYRSQASFIPIPCDRLFNFGELHEFWTFLEAHGFDTTPLTTARWDVRKTTRYAENRGDYAGNQPAAELAQLEERPHPQDFISPEFLQGLTNHYGKDVALYCEVVGKSQEEWAHSLLAGP